MRKIIGISPVILLIVALVGIGDAKDKKYPLKAIIESDKKVYKVGELINVEIKLTNIGKRPVTVYKRGDISVSINFGMKHADDS